MVSGPRWTGGRVYRPLKMGEEVPAVVTLNDRLGYSGFVVSLVGMFKKIK